MTSKEALERIIKSHHIAMAMLCEGRKDDETEKAIETIKQDMDRLEKLEKVIEILKSKFKFELGVAVVKEKYYYSLEFLYNNQYFTITQEEYNLLKEVLEND